MDYPVEILFASDESPAVARLKVIAIVALLDHGSFENMQFSEAEILPFTQEQKFTDTNGQSHGVYIRSHRFYSIEPTGLLASGVKKVLQAMAESIKAAQLATISARFDLNGEVDTVNTWVRLIDAQRWLRSRGIETGDLFHEYWKDDEKAFENALSAADSFRSGLEIGEIDVDAEVNELRRIADLDDAIAERFTELLRENLALKNAAQARAPIDRQLKDRERNTLLTIIAVLCKEAKLDHTKSAKAAGLIQSTAAEMGISIGETTIEGHLKKIPDALGTRMK